MLPTRFRRRSRLRCAVAPLAVGLLLVTASACGSDSDSGSDSAADSTVAVADPPVDSTAIDTTPVAETMPADDAGGGDATAICGGLSAADVGAAGGAEFDSADDISIDTDETCLFSNTTSTDGVTVMTESAETYLGGSLAGLSADDALMQLVAAESIALDEGFAVEQTTVAGNPAVVITGTNAMVGIPTGYASTVIDGVVIEVTLDGANLAPDAAGLSPFAAAVLELAVAAQG